MTTATKTQTDKAGHAAHTKAADSQLGLPGEVQQPIKIVMLGAGSMFTPRLLRDLLQIPGLRGGEIALVDIDTSRLDTMNRLVQKLVGESGLTDWTVTASPDRRQVMAGARYLVNCIEVSGVECVGWDNDIPLKYGIDQCIGDTIGPGGLFKALRTVPVFLDVLRDIEELCPDAWVLNYTNPMSIMCLAAGRSSRVPVVGLCHSVQGTSHKLARDAGVDYAKMTWACAGINHLAWFTRLEHEGQDLYPVLMEKVSERAGDVYESDPVRYDMMMHFGAFITESSGHLSEYLPYYRKNPDLVKEYCRDGYRGGSRFYASNWPQWRSNADEEREAMVRGDKDMNWSRSWEYASWIIEAREKDAPYRIHGNVMNQQGNAGPLISNLMSDGCVEVACMIDRAGIHPTRYGKLPAQMAAICDWNMRMFDLAATACMEKSKEAAIHALMLDPLTAAILCPAQIKQMTLELFEAEKDHLPGYR
ncbi:MAG: alpha-glucosidase/alpha-galactosidase [Phycisphaeraceae bacterium]|nr:alpha-glucosidase/alpha-galactosidase [Phycisphaeraceae bacterium]